jgi:hypothetical protein
VISFINYTKDQKDYHASKSRMRFLSGILRVSVSAASLPFIGGSIKSGFDINLLVIGVTLQAVLEGFTLSL